MQTRILSCCPLTVWQFFAWYLDNQIFRHRSANEYYDLMPFGRALKRWQRLTGKVKSSWGYTEPARLSNNPPGLTIHSRNSWSSPTMCKVSFICNQGTIGVANMRLQLEPICVIFITLQNHLLVRQITCIFYIKTKCGNSIPLLVLIHFFPNFIQQRGSSRVKTKRLRSQSLQPFLRTTKHAYVWVHRSFWEIG